MKEPKPFRPTREQTCAIEADGSAVVRAGAGSGKTSVLAARYVHLVSRGLRDAQGSFSPLGVEEILAITFTDKAASEMKDRIRIFLGERLKEATGSERTALGRARRDLVRAQISTIHGFCARMLRENPIEAGVDPASTVLDQREADDYLGGLIEGELRTAVQAGQEFARKLVRTRSLAGAVRFLREVIKSIGLAGIKAEQLQACFENQLAEASRAREQLAREIAKFLSAVEQWLATEPKGLSSMALPGRWFYWQHHLYRLSHDSSPQLVLALAQLARDLPARRLAPEIAAALRLERGKLKGQIAELAGFLASLPAAGSATDLVTLVVRAVERAKRSDGLVTFDDLITLALELLRSNGPVRRRYQERYRVVLVDEFQDVDARQGEIIELLSDHGRTSLFLVGDEKQSIYGFRGADVEVMGKFRSKIGQDIVLQTNFRSLPSILRFVNGVAALVMQPPVDAPAPYWVQWAQEHELGADRQDSPGDGEAVTVISLVGEVSVQKLSVQAVREIEAERLATMIVEICSSGERSYGDIAILLRAMTKAKIYEEALRRYGIPYRVVKGGKFFGCPEVCDLVNLVVAVDDPGDDQALAALLRSPFFSLSDDALYRLAAAGNGSFAACFSSRREFSDLGDEAPLAARALELLGELRSMRDRLTVAEIIEEAVRRTNLEAVLLGQFQGEQRVANVRKFIELARDAERERQFMLSEFARYAKGLVDSGSDEPEASVYVGQQDLVSIMSVHQAKGLEFPVVMLPDLARGVRGEQARLTVDPVYGILAAEEVGAAGVALPHQLMTERRNDARDRAQAESARLFYVALTRARDRLILSEGKGSISFLRSKRPARNWLEHIWDLVGRRQMLSFVEGDREAVVVEVAGTRVRLEKASKRRVGELTLEPRPVSTQLVTRQDQVRMALSRATEFQPPPFSRVTLSPVELGRFDRCPRMYYLARSNAYVEGTREKGGGMGPEAGTVGHAVLQILNPLDAPVDLAAKVAQSVSASGGALLPAHLRARLEKTLTESMAWLSSRYRKLELVGREVPFAFSLGKLRPAVVLRGRIDLIGREGDSLVVADYKFSSPREAGTKEYEVQLAAYAAALRRRFPGKDIRCEILYLGAGQQAAVMSQREMEEAEQRLPEIAARLVQAASSGAASDFPRLGPDLDTCTKWGCPYTRRCW